MKKLYFTVVMALLPALFFAQGTFDKYEKDANVTSFIAGKKTFTMLAKTKFDKNDENAKQGVELVNQIESVKVFTTNNKATASDMKVTVDSYSKSAGLEDLIQVNDSGKRITIKVKDGSKENTITQILVFVDDSKSKSADKEDETIIVLVTGNFDLDRISEILDNRTVTGDKEADDKQFTDLKNALQMKVSPNPATEVFYINTDEAAEVKMYDLSGRLVKQKTYTKAGISVSDLSPATYVVEITTGDKRQTERIIVK
jgi:hypothetical protein